MDARPHHHPHDAPAAEHGLLRNIDGNPKPGWIRRAGFHLDVSHTGTKVDVTPPKLIATLPNGGNIGRYSPAVMVYDRPMSPASLSNPRVIGFPTNSLPSLSDNGMTAYVTPPPGTAV